MNEAKNIGARLTLEKRLPDGTVQKIEGELVFNLNVLEKCVEKYQNMDDILNAFSNISAAKFLGVTMWNEAAEIWNEEHPDDKRPLITENQLGRMLDSITKINEFQQKIRDAMLAGLPKEQVVEVEELEKNLIAAQSGKMASLNREQRRSLK